MNFSLSVTISIFIIRKSKNSMGCFILIIILNLEVCIHNPFNEEIYDKIEKEETKGENRSACITYNKNNNDYFILSFTYTWPW